jgi:hypothetical protein
MRTLLTVVFVSTMASACVGEPDVSTRTQGVLEGNAIASNAIASNAIQLNAIASNAIASNQISNNLFQLNSTELLHTPEGRELLTYVVSCALPHEVTLTGRYAGVTYSFPGDLGLASAWTRRELRATEERWVSACLIARVNLFGIPVSISLRGPHDALEVSKAEAQDYSVEEGAFYGNVFHAVNEPLVWNACRGKGQAAGESGTLDLRDCTEEDPAHPGLTKCGFTYAGDCADWARPKNAYACKKFIPQQESGDCGKDDDIVEGGFYEQCYDSPGLGKWPHAEKFNEVITIYVMP